MADKSYDNLQKVIEGCIQKDDKARELLYKEYFGYAMSVALLYSSNRNDAIEIVNDSFMKVFSQIKRYNLSHPFTPWLRKIVINTAVDSFRRNQKRGVFSRENPPVLCDTSPGPLSNLNTKDIVVLLNCLPHIHKTIFCLYEIEGYSHQEISHKLKIPESTSRTYLTRAKQKLRELYNYG